MVKRILVGVDGSEASGRALAYAAGLAAPLQAELMVVHVVPPADLGFEGYPEVVISGETLNALEGQALEAGKALVRGALQKALEAGAKAQAELLFGAPAPKVAELAEAGGYDLVVVGSRGLGGLKRALLGSTSDRLAHLCHRPVLIVH